MNPYTMLSSGFDTREAAELGGRLSSWHDAMVAHERRLRAGGTNDACDDECPHAEARTLWPEAVAAFGTRAEELTFLRTRAQQARRGAAGGAQVRAEAADHSRRHGRGAAPASPALES